MARRRNPSPRRSRGSTSGIRWTLAIAAAALLGGAIWFFGPGRRAPYPSPEPVAVRPISKPTAAPAAAPAPLPPAREPTPPDPTAATTTVASVTFVPPPRPVPTPVADATVFPRSVANLLEAQIALARRHISSGAIDGVAGGQTAAALAAFQETAGLPPTGRFDEATRARLVLTEPALAARTLDADDFAGLAPLPPTWLGKSERPALAHETLLERLAERTQSHPNLLRRLNPSADWARLAPGATVLLPVVGRSAPVAPVAHLHVRLAGRLLQARATDGTLVAHFPVSIARQVDKRPVGALRITVVVPDPNYTFDPAVFTESAEARELGRKLILPPGPNNPVGVAWIGLDRPGYGLHGTPTPEQVGRTESHGCFRLANWDARALLALVRPGLPVYVEP